MRLNIIDCYKQYFKIKKCTCIIDVITEENDKFIKQDKILAFEMCTKRF